MRQDWLNRPHKRGNPEACLVRAILIYLKSRDWIAGKVKVRGFKTERGWINDPLMLTGLPDIFAFNDETKVMLGIEAKINNNFQTENQKVFQQLFHFPPSRIYAVIHSLEELQKIVS